MITLRVYPGSKPPFDPIHPFDRDEGSGTGPILIHRIHWSLEGQWVNGVGGTTSFNPINNQSAK